MAKRDIKKALGASLKAEERAVKSRFEKAGTTLGEREPAPREQPQQDGAGKLTTESFHLADGEEELLSRLKRRCKRAGISANKSEIVRAGLAALDRMQDRELERLFDGLTRAKSARPEPEILTFLVHRTYTIRFRHTLQIKHFRFARKIVIRNKAS
ncbi:MAG TPA: hypothetical protein VF544_12190 [Pyrinomonadaceae bacterium]|jgi:uncharacterized damage-inducible protein DinB